MRTVPIDDDVYQHLLENAAEIGEDASSILRRLLNLKAPSPAKPLLHAQLRMQAEAAKHELTDDMDTTSFRLQKTVVEKMLYLLNVMSQQKAGKFAEVLKLKGRGRVYFAKSMKEIDESGTSTQPRAIGKSGYWVLTNSPTPAKRQLMREVMTLLEYSQAAKVAVMDVLR
jgi:negative modulator of initiation of replication